MSKRLLIWMCALVLATVGTWAQDKARHDVRLLNRIYHYKSQIDTSLIAGSERYAYRKFTLDVKRRNVTLFPIPTMYRIAHSKRRRYIEETYYHIRHRSAYDFDITRIAYTSTIPQQKETMTTLLKFITPRFYEETIFGASVLSPFHLNNRIYYSYHFVYLHDGLVDLQFKPKVKNTQLTSGHAIIDSQTGRICSGLIGGEFDMIKFTLDFHMSDEGWRVLFPDTCRLSAEFNFMGNIVRAQTHVAYGPGKQAKRANSWAEAYALIDSIRCDTLSTQERQLYADYLHETGADSTDADKRKRSWAKRLFWDTLGDNLLNKITSSYGDGGQGYVRISPLFNPLYMGYSGHKGYYYKFDARNRYNFNDNSYLYTRFKAGYSFKRRQLYFTMPIEYHFDQKHNGYVKLQLANGNWVGNGILKDDLLETLPDTIRYDADRLPYFRDYNMTLEASYDLSRHFTLQLGVVGHRRTAVESGAYKLGGKPSTYTSMAPKIEVIWRPRSQGGPVINAAYERSINGLIDADIAYERWEFDIQHIIALNRLRYFSFRGGCGFYTLSDGTKYFLDYTNFRDNNIPDGWYDEWTGEFSLLPSHWYNLSRYYVRANATYETPLLALSRLPWIGHFIEKERIYLNVLTVTHLHPYTETGYGLTTRWASMGVFIAHRNGRYDGVGVKFGLELFRQW